MPKYITDNHLTLAQMITCCHQATSHYLSQCWPRSMPPYGVTRPHQVFTRGEVDDFLAVGLKGHKKHNTRWLMKKIKPVYTWTCTWWRHLMETFSALLALCAGNSPITGESPSQRPVTRSFDIFFRLCLNKRSKQLWGWWFETPSCSLLRHCNGMLQPRWWFSWTCIKIVSRTWSSLYVYICQAWSTWNMSTYRWLSARLQYLHCWRTGDTAVLY